MQSTKVRLTKGKKTYEVFISYSRKDAKFIAPLVQLVGAVRKDLVFQDSTEIEPGDLWEEKLLGAIDSAEIILVFWCCHSAGSPYVRKEYLLGLEKDKRVIPLLLDHTPLTYDISRSQGIDLRNNSIHDPRAFFLKVAWNECKKFLVQLIPALGTSLIIEDIKGPREVAEKILELLNRFLPNNDEE